MRKMLKLLSFLPAILMMLVIFNFSSQSGDVSSQLSQKVSVKIVEAGDYIFSAGLEDWQINEWADKIGFITRKLAHMTEYFLLAVAVSFPLYVYGLHGIGLMLVAGIICVGFAAGDEYHQSFVAGRGPSLRDVGIDSIGVFFGIILVRMIGWTGRKTLFRPKKKMQKVKKVKYKNTNYYQETSRRQKKTATSHQNHHAQPDWQGTPQGYQHPPVNHGPYPNSGFSGYNNSYGPQGQPGFQGNNNGYPPYMQNGQPNPQATPYPQQHMGHPEAEGYRQQMPYDDFYQDYDSRPSSMNRNQPFTEGKEKREKKSILERLKENSPTFR